MSHTPEPTNAWCIILNPVSGKRKGSKRWPEIKAILDRLELNYHKHITKSHGHIKALIAQGLTAGFRHFLLIGGDGTQFEAIDAIYKQHAVDPKTITLACLPAGTGNDWSRTVYPNAAFEDILKAMKRNQSFAHDVGWVSYQKQDGEKGKHYFLNIAGLGFDAYVAANFLPPNKALGPVAYLSGLIRGLISFKPSRAKIKFNDQTIEGDAFILAAGICKYFGGGMKITPNAEPDDGLFDLTVVQNISKLKLIANLYRIYKGTFTTLPEVGTFRTDAVHIHADEPLYLQVDGELLGHTPVEMGVIPSGIKVISL